MKTDWPNRSGWLLVILIALIAAAYFWLRSEPNKLVARPADQLGVNHASVKHAQSTPLAPTAVPRSTISADGTAAVPIRFQLANIGRVRTAPSFH